MKLGVSMWSYFHAWKAGRLDLVGFIHEAKRIGADGVELLDFFYKNPDEERGAVMQALQDTGLPCPIFSVSQNFAKQTDTERAAELEKIKFGVDEANRLGAGVVRVFSGDVAEGITFDQARAWIVEGLAAGARYAQENGVKLALENHGTLAGRGEQVRGLILDVRAAAGNDALGANPDTGNFLVVGQAAHEAIREVAPFAYMVHFKDFAPAPEGAAGTVYQGHDGARLQGTAIGEGAVDLAACVSVLREADYDGWLSLEYEADEDPMTGVPRSMANARRIAGLS